MNNSAPPPPPPSFEQKNKSQTTSLKLCFCPLCEGKNYLLQKQPLQWILIARIVLFSLRKKEDKEYFAIDTDIKTFVVDHWHFFGQLRQFTENENWLKNLTQQFSNKDFFLLSEDKKSVKLTNDVVPFDYESTSFQEVQNNANNLNKMNENNLGTLQNQSLHNPLNSQNNNQTFDTEQIQNDLKESYIKTLQIAKVAYLTCQKALYAYNDDASKANIMAQMEELQKVINETNYLLGFFQK